MLRRSVFQLPKRQVLWQCRHGKFFHNTAFSNAISNLCMPALSPTMEEGNIAKWSLKEGDSYKAGDVILEVETDKATMDVEAQDDGVLAKIIINSGTKIPVGKEIAIIAEEGDDLSKINLPDASSTTEKSENLKTPTEPSSLQTSSHADSSSSQSTPLLPSVAYLLHLHKIQDPSVIPATGPRGRLLKGDVLSFIGEIKKDAPGSVQKAIQKLEKLDFSKVEAKPVKGQLVASPTTTEKPSEAIPEKPRLNVVETSLSLVNLINMTNATKEKNEKLPEKITNIVSSAVSDSLASSEILDLFQDPVENAYDALLGLSSSRASVLPKTQLISGKGPVENVVDFLCHSSIILPGQLSGSAVLSFAHPNPPLNGKTTLDDAYDCLLGSVREHTLPSPSQLKNEEIVLKLSYSTRINSDRAASFMNKLKRNLEVASLN
ncbi:pyruvate dehydrogenase X component [Schizosaccharomyces cryophilus OY26]|uniref:Pyruvate dehydrogenase X component n=1 Tax=Schizosaccharomyces cryophilus (strain OY26 / ATCC MYA-4695 / CBS 11777 / NBRC 106824 / NRRL Y48691) TaxID=653667 RepID=S9WYB3_SCHCR|nr:pyruvate dehydrogenase X component [Schizosaccharomyces cryophilus OY26]EPY49722.1 pyruvate dehydrogenase X component [Schizosaccharomyces cryophilus OY26]